MGDEKTVVDRPIIVQRQRQRTGQSKFANRFHQIVEGLLFTVFGLLLPVVGQQMVLATGFPINR